MGAINFNIFLAVSVAIVLLKNLSFAQKLDHKVGSNWRVSKSDVVSSAYNSGSSFLPTASVPATVSASVNPQTMNSAGNIDYSKYYYQDESGKYYPMYQLDESSYTYRPTDIGPEQRQEFFDGDGGGTGVFGGLANGIGGAATGVASAVGLGGLGAVGGVIVAILAVPIIILLVLFPVAILVTAILGLPVLQITLPEARGMKRGFMEGARKAKEVLQSEECIERLSCILARKSRKLPYENWILTRMDNTSNTWAHRVSKSIKFGRSGGDCDQFKCSTALKVKRAYDSVISLQRNL